MMEVHPLPWGPVLSQAERIVGDAHLYTSGLMFVRGQVTLKRTWEAERLVELPLALDHADLERPGLVLDAGGALNIGPLTASTLQARVVHLVQALTSEPVLFPQGYASYLAADLRDLRLLADGVFDRTVCISTLEHIGLDNSAYGGAVETNPASVDTAVRELLRVTRGPLLFTVPFDERGLVQRKAKAAAAEWRQFTTRDIQHVQQLAARRGSTVLYYHTAGDGWYGGAASPAFVPVPEPGVVNQIAAIRVEAA